MQIEVDKLSGAGESFAHNYAPDELSLNDDRARLIGGASIRGRARRRGEQIQLRGTISAQVESACDRCLRPVTLPVEVEFEAPYLPAGSEASALEETELHEHDLDYSVYEGGLIDVDELMREQVLLALPTRLLCREECRGLCSTCGADLSEEPCACAQEQIDPRWAALVPMKEDQS